MTETRPRALRAQPDGPPPHRRRPHRRLQLGVRPPHRRHVRAPHRRHRPRAIHGRATSARSSPGCAGWDSTGTRARRSAATWAPTSRPSARTPMRDSLEAMKASRCGVPMLLHERGTRRRSVTRHALRAVRWIRPHLPPLDPDAAAARLAAGDACVWRLAVPEDRGDVVFDRRDPRRDVLPGRRPRRFRARTQRRDTDVQLRHGRRRRAHARSATSSAATTTSPTPRARSSFSRRRATMSPSSRTCR